MSPPVPVSAVFDNSFETAAGPIEAGTSFALAIDGLPVALVTCQHLFGPAGGLSQDVPPAMMSRFVPRAAMRGALGVNNALRATTGAAVIVPRADAGEAATDLAAFPLEPNASVTPLEPVAPQEGKPLYLAARLRQGAPEDTWLFPATIVGEPGPQLINIAFDAPDVFMPGTSGAPVLDEQGRFVGMVVRFDVLDEGRTEATLLGASAVVELLREVEWPAPKKQGFWQKLFG